MVPSRLTVTGFDDTSVYFHNWNQVVALNRKTGKTKWESKPVDQRKNMGYVYGPTLVAYDDVIQYIVDGKLNYQLGRGDRIQIEERDNKGQPQARDAVYDLDRFPVYRQGYFGFRMVSTHHIYSNFKVYALEPAIGGR